MLKPLGVIILVLATGLAGCSSKGLRNLRSTGDGPDEFKILPTKPLTMPENYAQLPPPVPGGSNLVDRDPKGEAVAALGGRASALTPQGVPASEGTLVSQASRYGVAPDTRTTLAEADAQFRKRQARFTRVRLFPVDRYEQAYRSQAIDPFSTTENYRRAGLATPTAPPVRD